MKYFFTTGFWLILVVFIISHFFNVDTNTQVFTGILLLLFYFEYKIRTEDE